MGTLKKKAEGESCKLMTLEGECLNLKSMLESERDQVERLTQSQEELREIPSEEKKRVKNLVEEQAVTETEVEEMNSEEISQASSIEEKLMEAQATIDHHRYRVSALEGNHNELTETLEEEKVSSHVLDASLKELNISNEEIAHLTEFLKIEKLKVAEIQSGLHNVQKLLRDEKERVVEYERLLETQKHLSVEDQSKIRKLEHKIEEHLAALELGTIENNKLEADLSETRSLLDTETKKVGELLDSGHNYDGARATALLASEQNKVKALEHSREQLMSLLDWEKKHVLSLEERQEELQEQNESDSEELVVTTRALQESQKKVLKLSAKLGGFDKMRNEIIRLTLAARQRDVMMAALLDAIGDAKAIKAKEPVQNAEKYVNELQARIGDIDLAGLDGDTLKDREARQLVLYNVVSRKRNLRNIVLPLIPIGGLIAYHHHDPTALRELSSDLRSNFGEYSHNLGQLSSSITANLSANMGQLASAIIDSELLREPVTQVIGMATRRVNIKQV